MARTTNGTSDSLVSAALTALDSAANVTLAGWVYRASSGTTSTVGLSITTAQNPSLLMNHWSDDVLYMVARNTFADNYAYTGTIASSGWHHYALWFDGGGSGDANKVRIYYDGTNQSLTYSEEQPTSLGTTLLMSLGRDYSVSALRYAAGGYANWGAWLGNLGQAEITALSKGASPLRIRPNLLTNYWPIVGKQSPEPDLVGGYGLTVTGSTTVVQPRLIRPRPQIWRPNAAAASGRIMSSLTRHGGLAGLGGIAGHGGGLAA